MEWVRTVEISDNYSYLSIYFILIYTFYVSKGVKIWLLELNSNHVRVYVFVCVCVCVSSSVCVCVLIHSLGLAVLNITQQSLIVNVLHGSK